MMKLKIIESYYLMKRIYKKIMWAFFATPRHAAEWAEQNEMRISAAIGIILTTVLILLLFGQLPTWAD